MPKADPVEDRGFFDRAGGKRFILALKKSESGGVHGGIVGDCFNILGLLPSLPNCINVIDQ